MTGGCTGGLRKLTSLLCGASHPGKEPSAANFPTKEIGVRPSTAGRCSSLVTDNPGRIEDSYKLDSEKIGQGAFAYVVKATMKQSSTMVRAVKVLAKSHLKDTSKFLNEIDLMKELDHPNILHLFEAFEDQRNIYMVIELCTGGELFDRILALGNLSEEQAAIILRQILSAVYYMHRNLVAHRDLKPENFIFVDKQPLEKSNLKVIDFGLATRFKPGQLMKTKAGTPYYVAPQVLEGTYDASCDVWACGVIMYILLCGAAPFDGQTDAEILKKVRKGKFSFPSAYWKHVSFRAQELITKMLKFDPKDRFSAEEALHDPWLDERAPKAAVSTAPADMLARFRAFRAKNKLAKTALRMIAWRLSESEIKSLRETFVALDTNNDGILTLAELKDGLANLGLREVPADLQVVMEAVDADSSGAIDYTEFVAAMLRTKTYVQDDLCWSAFRMLDKNGDGKISAAEVSEVLQMGSVEEAMGAESIQKLMSEVDTNGDGEIDFDEFMAMMRA